MNLDVYAVVEAQVSGVGRNALNITASEGSCPSQWWCRSVLATLDQTGADAGTAQACALFIQLVAQCCGLVLFVRDQARRGRGLNTDQVRCTRE